MNDGQILRHFIDNKPIKITKVVDLTGIKRPTIYTHFAKQKLDISIKSVYTNAIGINWEDEKLVSKNSAPNPRLEAEPLHIASDPNDFDNDGAKFEDLGDGILRMRIPIVPFKAYAGYLRGYKDPEYYEDLKTVSIDVHKEYRGHYLAFEVMGDSMVTNDPNLFDQMALPGWKAVARELLQHHWKYKLHTHKTDTWIIVHNTEGILIKNIINHDVDAATITIHSLNPKYKDEILSLNDIVQIFSVVKYIVDK